MINERSQPQQQHQKRRKTIEFIMIEGQLLPTQQHQQQIRRKTKNEFKMEEGPARGRRGQKNRKLFFLKNRSNSNNYENNDSSSSSNDDSLQQQQQQHQQLLLFSKTNISTGLC
jgi:hypothetical protein